jgi:hypothetical protein
MQTVLRLRANGAQERGRERSGWGLAATPGEPRMIETEWHTHGNECMRRKETRTKHSGCAHVPYVREEGEATVKGTMPTTWRRWQGTHLRNGANIFTLSRMHWICYGHVYQRRHHHLRFKFASALSPVKASGGPLRSPACLPGVSPLNSYSTHIVARGELHGCGQ